MPNQDPSESSSNSRIDPSAIEAFLAGEPDVKALHLTSDGKSILVATLGKVDPDTIATHLREVVDKSRQLPKTTHLPGWRRTDSEAGARWERLSCPTAPRLWKWREIPLATKETAERVPETDWHMLALLSGICGVLGITGWILEFNPSIPGYIPLLCYVLAMIAGGYDASIDSYRSIKRGILDIHFLMLAAAIGSATIGAWGEGVLLLFLFSFSGALEHFALHRTTREINSLIRGAPKTATRILADGSESIVPVDILRPGDLLLVRPGDSFPVDGDITEGSTAVDESMLTGESTSIEKSPGLEVFSGTLNLWGAVTVRVLRPAENSALQNVIRLVTEAQRSRAPSQRFTDRFGTPYTWFVLGITTSAFLLWWLGAGLPAFHPGEDSASAFYRAMTLMVVASPCALVLSIPASILAAIAWGARHGVLFRGGQSIEDLAKVDVVCLDKTGTLTTGEPKVLAVESFPQGNENAILAHAYALEANSTHPLARAISSHAKQLGLPKPTVDDFRSLNGKGLSGRSGDSTIILGRRELVASGPLAKSIQTIAEPGPGETEVWVATHNLIGRIILRDEARKESAAALANLRKLGLKLRMLTGDRPAAAKAIGKQVGLRGPEILSGLHPADKVTAINELTAKGHHVAMVGDGINDAPSLAAAHVSLAMGARGSDAALEQASIILMHDRIENVHQAILLSHRARRIIKQNLTISLGTVLIMIALTLSYPIPLTLGVFAHEGSTVLVCLNALRLLFLNAPGTNISAQ